MSASTVIRISRPISARSQYAETLTKIRAEPIVANKIAARVDPMTVPVPPRIDTPPITEAVMIVSSRFGGTVDWMTCSWVAKRIAASPAKKP